MTELYLRKLSEYERLLADKQIQTGNGFSVEENLLKRMDRVRRERFQSAGNEKVRLESLGASLFLHEVLCIRLGLEPAVTAAYEFGYTQNGKPFLADPAYRHIEFNISHSEDWICCAVGTVPVGVDLQKIGAPERTERELRIAERFFTAEEYEELLTCKDVGSRFAQLWTIKEAYVKLKGMRVLDGLDHFQIIRESGKAIEIREQGSLRASVWEPDAAECLENYRLAVCTEKPEEIRIRYL